MDSFAAADCTGQVGSGGQDSEEQPAGYAALAALQSGGPPLTHKVCALCNEVKSVDEFGRRQSHEDGLRNECKRCQQGRLISKTYLRNVPLPTVEHKVCSKCNTEKPATEFPRDKYRADGLKTNCKACNAKVSSDWRKRLAPVMEPTVHEKVCKRCNILQRADGFFRDKSSADGLNRYCKACNRECKRETFLAQGAVAAARVAAHAYPYQHLEAGSLTAGVLDPALAVSAHQAALALELRGVGGAAALLAPWEAGGGGASPPMPVLPTFHHGELAGGEADALGGGPGGAPLLAAGLQTDEEVARRIAQVQAENEELRRELERQLLGQPATLGAGEPGQGGSTHLPPPKRFRTCV